MAETPLINGFDDLNFLKKKLPFFAERAAAVNERLAFFYLKAQKLKEILQSKQTPEALDAILKSDFDLKSLTEDGSLIGVHEYSSDRSYQALKSLYQTLGDSLRKDLAKKNIRIGTASIFSAKGNYDITVMSLENLAELSLKGNKH